jgi:Ser/Thr protein kinase RdoA (MazF antagonist)
MRRMPAQAPAVVHLPPAAVSELSHRFELSRLLVTGRWVGATSSVLRLGDALCIKVPHHDDAAVAACLRHAKVAPVARRWGVKAPELIGVEELEAVPVPVVVSRFLPGHSLPRDTSQVPAWRSVGADLARLHSGTPVDVDVPLRSFTQHDGVDPGRLAEQASDAGLISSTTARAVQALRDRLVDDVVPDDRHVLCHGDLHTENVLVNSGDYSGLLDFAGAGWMDSAWDFAAIPLNAVTSCLEGYATRAEVTEQLLHRIAWCRLQLAMHRLPTTADPQDEAAHALRQATLLIEMLQGSHGLLRTKGHPASSSTSVSRPSP